MALSLGDLRFRSLGVFGAVGGALIDLVAMGGDTIGLIAVVFIETVDLWVPFLSHLSSLGRRVEWIPTDIVETAFIVALALLVGVYAVRIIGSIKENLRN